MKKGQNAPLETELMAAGMLATGKTQSAVAKAMGVHQATISRIGQKHKNMIEEAQARLIENALDPIVDRAVAEIKAASTMGVNELKDSQNQKFLDRVDKKEEMVLKSVGIAAHSSQSIHVQNVFNNNSKTVLNPVVLNLLNDHTKRLMEGEEDDYTLQSEED